MAFKKGFSLLSGLVHSISNQLKPMSATFNSVDDYINQVPDDKKAAFLQLRNTILAHLPLGFQECISYGMIGYVVPHSIYPNGYHCNPKLPLPFASIAAQKNAITIYHMGIYANPEIIDWFTTEFPKYSTEKLDIGKSCIRFKKLETIPFDLIGILFSKITMQQWITSYEKQYKK